MVRKRKRRNCNHERPAGYGAWRPDVGAAYGSQFNNSGYSVEITGLPAGYYHLVVYAHSTVTWVWNPAHRVIQVV